MTPTLALLPLCLPGTAALAAPVLDDAVRNAGRVRGGLSVGGGIHAASAKDQFFFRAIDAELAFTRDATGKIVSAVLTQGGQDVVLPRKQ